MNNTGYIYDISKYLNILCVVNILFNQYLHLLMKNFILILPLFALSMLISCQLDKEEMVDNYRWGYTDFTTSLQ